MMIHCVPKTERMLIHGIEDNDDADFKPYRLLETPLSPRRTFLHTVWLFAVDAASCGGRAPSPSGCIQFCQNLSLSRSASKKRASIRYCFTFPMVGLPFIGICSFRSRSGYSAPQRVEANFTFSRTTVVSSIPKIK
eukprot:6178271-Pleurochrysis_carterae.AAC.1